MKTKIVSAVIVVLIASIALSSFAAIASAAPKPKPLPTLHTQYHSFTLTATGDAKNAEGQDVAVSLSIEGNVNGKLKTVFHLHTQSGDATIEGYDSIAAVRGQGVVVNKNNFVHLVVMMSSDSYGGRSTLWVLRGTTESLTQSDTMSISLEAPRVVLPINGYPQLTELKLDGTISFQ